MSSEIPPKFGNMGGNPASSKENSLRSEFSRMLNRGPIGQKEVEILRKDAPISMDDKTNLSSPAKCAKRILPKPPPHSYKLSEPKEDRCRNRPEKFLYGKP